MRVPNHRVRQIGIARMASLIKAIAAYARQDFPEITVTKVFKRFSCYYFLLLIRLIVNHVALHHS